MALTSTPSVFDQQISVWAQTTTLNTQGRSVEHFANAGISFIGIIASATPKEKLLYSQPNHDVDSTIVHRGTPVARVGDQLRFREMHYYITEVLNPGRIGRWTIYYCDMRRADPSDTVDPNV